ncbi:ABC transporter ATP-binding protein [Agarilytica rhodophyticola]|uniref:ABC transporter ATP-binding protein n=1 Tax=Agarilytica rhodophyticola TaxID=1737490 RepID=UPI000B342D49|nr:ABC transporter ATP-binding protein [Agarilytica rhodophyticola]
MLHVSNLTRRYDNFVAVNNASFAIKKGEIVGLLGHNGAGKTTVMKMLSGYLEPDNGTVVIDDIDLAAAPKAAQRKLGYLPENLPIYPEMSVADYLDYAAMLKGLTHDKKIPEIKRAIQATDIAAKLLDPIYTLSRGYKQRVGVAQAILGQPKLLILDEPTNGLDPTQTEHMRTLIRDIAKDATVILSTHIMQEVEAICDRVLILNRGELVVDEKLAQLRQSEGISVHCSFQLAAFNNAIKDIAGFKADYVTTQNIATKADTYAYKILLPDNIAADIFCADIARAIVEKGGKLYQLNNDKRDLESLFKDINRGSNQNIKDMEVDHAA